jgi:hypothetical protein
MEVLPRNFVLFNEVLKFSGNKLRLRILHSVNCKERISFELLLCAKSLLSCCIPSYPASFCRWGRGEGRVSERLGNLLKVTQLVNARALVTLVI